MPKKIRNERNAARRSDVGRTLTRSRVRSNEQATPRAPERGHCVALFEPLERRQLLSTTSFESLPVGNLGSAGYTDPAGFKFVNLPGSGGTSQGNIFVHGTSQGYSSKVLSTENWGRKIVVTRADGANFDLASFDYAAGRWGEAGDATVTAYFSNGSSTQTSYSFNSRTLKRLAPAWKSLKRVEINFSGGSNAAYGSVDNFVFNEASSGGGTVFPESGGRADLQAEVFTSQVSGSGKTWSSLTDSGAIGGKGLVALTNTGLNLGDNTSGPRTDYAVNFSSTGTYYIWVRMKGDSGNDDSLHLGTNGTPFTLGVQGVTPSYNEGGKWIWKDRASNGSRLAINVGSTGVRTLNLWMREDGVKVDSIILTKDGAFNPAGGGGTTDDGGTDDSGTNDGATKPDARITAASSLSVMAGMSVHVNGISSLFGVGDIDTSRMEWDFGDPYGKRNTVVGWNAAHLYENPGTYTIRLKLWNEARGFDDATVTVNVASNTRRKIYVSPSGNDSNSGTSTSSPVRTIPRAVNIMRANNGNTEILLQRGARHDLASTQSIDRQNVLIGAYGTGANPVVWWTRGRYDTKAYFLLGYGTSNITLRDLTFDTPYSGDKDATNMPHAVQPAGTNVTIYNNEFRHVGDAVAGNAVPKAVLVLNNRVPSDIMLRRYFAWIEGSDWTILDNSVPNSTREHITRVGNGSRINISHNQFSNLDKRSTDPYDYAKGVINVQKGSYAYIASNTTRGPSGVGPLGGGDGLNDTASRFKHAVFEGNRLNGPFHIEHGAEDIEVRNNILQSDIELQFAVQGYNATYNRTTRNVRIVNNTGINHNTFGHFVRAWAGTSGMIVSNNLYYAPNLYVGPNASGIVRIHANDLNGFSRIDNNVWADAEWMDWAGGIMWVGTGTDNSGYLDKAEWLALSQVADDKFSDTAIDGAFKPASGSVATTAGDRVPGVMVDYYGKWRPDSDGRTVGAVTN